MHMHIPGARRSHAYVRGYLDGLMTRATVDQSNDYRAGYADGNREARLALQTSILIPQVRS